MANDDDAKEGAVARLLEEAMHHEEEARDLYIRAAEFSEEQDLKTLLSDLAGANAQHQRALETTLHELQPDRGEDPDDQC